jgi:HAD superfamily hydrolase (TIGR01459 family)
MTTLINSLADIAGQFDAVVLDQWGVLHDGSTPYPGAVDAVKRLRAAGTRLAVLSNSGKRAGPNLDRIAAMGFDAALFDVVITSGEALWRDIAAGRVAARSLYPIERAAGDAQDWAQGLTVALTDTIQKADALLLMGLPDAAEPGAFDAALDFALAHKLPVLCTNPDRASPRAGGDIVASPGALAHAHAARGGTVTFYGKPHLPVFRSIAAALDVSPPRLLMVGDSLEHDIAGATAAGWSSVFVQGGLHAAAFVAGDPLPVLRRLADSEAVPLPTFTLKHLR